MVFNSFEYAIFLPIVFGLYWKISYKYRWLLLLVVSYYFYMSWNAKYIVLIFLTTLVSYLTAICVERAKSIKIKKACMLISVIGILLVLFVFKYFNFFSNSIGEICRVFAIDLHPISLKLLLPVGISFYTFQTLSYVIDVYKGKIEAEKHFGIYAAFISFFPQLVAGPIERTENLLPQIKEEHKFDYEQAVYGARLMLWGFFKKMAIADTLAVYVDTVYNNYKGYQGFALVLAVCFFSIQIYCDFSGYSDIAIGTAKLFGINLMTNFRSPYFSKSIKEFWSRWHISLSTWFRDYVYIPLGGNRKGEKRRVINLLVTFLVSGLWHGANYTYIIWGGLHGAIQIIENKLVKKKTTTNKLLDAIKVIGVFAFCTFAWIFFRASNLREVYWILINLFVGIENPLNYLKVGLWDLKIINQDVFMLALMYVLLFGYDYVSLKKDVILEVGKLPVVARWGMYIILLWMIVLFTPNTDAATFIYFQF